MSLDTLGLFNVKGRVALVTGGSSGIGLMISRVRALLSQGSSVDNSYCRAWYQMEQKYISSLYPATPYQKLSVI